MCDKRKPDQDPPDPPPLNDEQVRALIAIARSAMETTAYGILAEVMRATMIDDKQERIATVTALMMRLQSGEQPKAN